MNNIPIRAKRMTSRLDIPALAYATAGSSGLDLYAAIDEPVSMRGGSAASIPVGFAVEIPEGFEGHVRGRSGLAKNDHIGITNGLGTIDSDFRGELVVLLSHFGHITEHKWIMPGEKIAQLVIAPVMHALVEEVDELSDTERGTGGFGSTGNGLATDAPQTPAAPAPTPAAPVTAQMKPAVDPATVNPLDATATTGNAAAGAAGDQNSSASQSDAAAGSATDAGTSSGTADGATDDTAASQGSDATTAGAATTA